MLHRILFLVLFLSTSLSAEEAKRDLTAFAQQYFNAMVATQMPGATEKALDQYLQLLTDDVGHTHLPWVTDGARLPDGKQAMRKGMLFYLGAHSEFNAELLDVFTFNTSAVAIRYRKSAKGIHPQTKQAIEYSDVFMEVLELEKDKVAVIRKYHQ